MSTSASDFNAQVIEEFRANDGVVGGMFEGMTLLLLHHTGARSAQPYVDPLAYLADDGRYVIFASAAGAPKHPAWYHNLKAHPQVQLEVGTDTLDAVATEATGKERDRLYDTMSGRSAAFIEYQEKAGRIIPVMILAPA
jgi:deazaflavin-dependent oxidoreductase (nitroreductase family)